MNKNELKQIYRNIRILVQMHPYFDDNRDLYAELSHLYPELTRYELSRLVKPIRSKRNWDEYNTEIHARTVWMYRYLRRPMSGNHTYTHTKALENVKWMYHRSSRLTGIQELYRS